MIPGILVGAAVAVAVAVGVAVAVSGTGHDESVARQLETWSRCLRSEGAPVPLVESLGDGGFRVTFDAAVLDGVPAITSVSAAFGACRDDAPDLLRTFLDRFDLSREFPSQGDFFGLPPGDGFFGPGPGHLEGVGGPFGGIEPGEPNLDEAMLDQLCERVGDRLESGLGVPPRLHRACGIGG